jgi:hypothetical protein
LQSRERMVTLASQRLSTAPQSDVSLGLDDELATGVSHPVMDVRI